MRLIKKILLDRANEITQFKGIKSAFTKLKNNKNLAKVGICSVKDISKLQFYFVIEYTNIIQNKVDYNKIFPDSKSGESTSINYTTLLNEQEKIKNYIENNQNNIPEYFKRIGITKEITGCYLIATIKKPTSIRNIDLNKKEHCLFYKFDDKNNLPKEFEQMCNDYVKKKHGEIQKEHDEYQKFISLNDGEKDITIYDFLHNIKFPTTFLPDSHQIEGEFFIYHPTIQTGITIESVAENNIGKINDIKFLNTMMNLALEKENYELCAIIRDRIKCLNII